MDFQNGKVMTEFKVKEGSTLITKLCHATKQSVKDVAFRVYGLGSPAANGLLGFKL